MAERYINAYDLAEIIENLDITVAGKPARWNDAKYSVLKEIAEAPDADVVEVVRCKDCEYCKYNISAEVFKCDRRGLLETVTPTDFCSWGKPKGE